MREGSGKLYWLFASRARLALLRFPLRDGLARLAEPLQPLSPVGRELVRAKIVHGTVEPILLGVDRLGLEHAASGDLAEVPLLLDNHPIALRLVLRGDSFDLGPVQRRAAELHQSQVPAEFKHVVEEIIHEWQALLTEAGEGREVQVLVGGEPPGRHDFVGRLLQHAQAPDPTAIAVEGDLEEHTPVEDRPTSLLILLSREERSEVEVLVDHLREDGAR